MIHLLDLFFASEHDEESSAENSMTYESYSASEPLNEEDYFDWDEYGNLLDKYK